MAFFRLNQGTHRAIGLAFPLGHHDEVPRKPFHPSEKVCAGIRRRLFEGQDLYVVVVETQVVSMTFGRRITDLVVDELVVAQGRPFRLVWGEIQEAPENEVGLLLIEQAQWDYILKLNHKAHDPLSKNLARTRELLLQVLLCFFLRKQPLESLAWLLQE